MKRIFAILIISFLFSGCKNSNPVSYWNHQPFVIDGQLDEWAKNPLFHFDEDLFSVGIQNDSNNLYLLLATRDGRLMRIINRSGVKVWLKGNKGKRKSFGIHYVGNFSEQELPMMPSIKPDMQKDKFDKERQREFKGTVRIISEKQVESVNINNTGLVDAADNIYKGVYLIEIKLPLKKDIPIYAFAAKPGEKIEIGVESGIDRNSLPKKFDRSGMGGGMRGGGMDRGTSNIPKRMPTKTEVWFSSRLALPQN